MSELLIEKLCNVDLYDHPVSEFAVLETHISWLILTGLYVYKIKKPVNLGFLNFSTLALREVYCQEEIRLNRRFSEDRYIGVVAITGSVANPAIGGDGEVIDYAVKMREFDQSNLLDVIAEKGDLTIQQSEDIGRLVAQLHTKVDVAQDDTLFGTAEQVWQPVAENFHQISPLLVAGQFGTELDELMAWFEEQHQRLFETFTQRRQEGFVRECHGDLHLGNMLLGESGCEVFDCLEFSPQLRWIDTMSEIAFLMMDLESRGLKQHSLACLNGYLEESGDYAGLSVLKFYKTYRAMVRAKVALLKHRQLLEEAVDDGAAIEAALTDFRRYLKLAQSYVPLAKTRMLITHGVSGSGKTTVAKKVAGLLDCVLLRSDVERKRMFNLKASDNSRLVLEKSIYTPEVSARLFAQLRELAAMIIKTGQSLIVDATFLEMKQRSRFADVAKESHVPFLILDCRASVDTIEVWLNKRVLDKKEASEADFSIAKAQYKSYEPLSIEEVAVAVCVQTDSDWSVEDVVEKIKLKSKTP